MESDISKFVLRILFPILGSILIGLMFLSTTIFQISSSAFQFVGFGIFGAIVLATTKVTSSQKSFVALVLAAFFYELILFPLGTHLIIRDVLFLLGIGSAIIVFRSYFYQRLNGTIVARPLVLAAMLAINGIVITYILRFAFSFFFEGIHEPAAAASANLGFGFLIGLGLGAGDEFAELSKQQWKLLFQA